MELQILRVPPLGTNCYFITEGTTLGIVDPGGAGDSIIRTIEEQGLSPQVILLTHGHFDHAGAANALKTHFGIPIVIQKDDAAMLLSAEGSHAARYGYPYESCKADRLLSDGDTVSVGSSVFTVLHTPGHTPGSCCYLCGDILLSGDTLFCGSIGRFDGRNKAAMRESIRRLLALDEAVRVYPGHEADTTIYRERRTNPFANFDWEWE